MKLTMKMGLKPSNRAVWFSTLVAMALPLASQANYHPLAPEQFGVIDVIVSTNSIETSEDSEPSLAVGAWLNSGEVVLHSFTSPFPSTEYANIDFSVPAWWTVPSSFTSFDATLDWDPWGNCYLANQPSAQEIDVLVSPDPNVFGFSVIPAATLTKTGPGFGLDQPWIRVVNVLGQEHVFVGYMDKSGVGDTARILFSPDGSSWTNFAIDTALGPNPNDFGGVRVGGSPDQQTSMYALFERTTGNSGPDVVGDVVLVRSDAAGENGFGDLGSGTVVAHGILPSGTTLGAQRLGTGLDVAAEFYLPFSDQVYVAYTDVVGGIPVLHVLSSTDSGGSFVQVFSTNNASLPALALATDGTVGLLYLMLKGGNLEVHFLKAYGGDFQHYNDRALARFPNNQPQSLPDGPYLGDYFTLKAIDWNFFGAFSASNDPDVNNFPSHVYYQRYVKIMVNGTWTVTNNLVLPSSGMLDDGAGHKIPISIDPFFFYDIAPIAYFSPPSLAMQVISDIPLLGTLDPLAEGGAHVAWPGLPTNQPQFKLLTSTTLGPGANWTLATNNLIIETNGLFEAAILPTNAQFRSQPQQFFRLGRDVRNAMFPFFVAAGENGVLSPRGILSIAGMANQTFTALPANNFGNPQWYLDGNLVQSGAPTLTVNNITSEHTLVVTFVPSNDLAVTVFELPSADVGATLTGGTNVFSINIQNQGLSPLTGILMSNQLPSMVSFVSAASSQGIVSNSGSVVGAEIGSLGPGASATVSISFVPLAAGSITDVVSVACSQFEPNLANNAATDVTTVLEPVIITNQPASQTVPIGGTATFTVGVSGVPPFFYQWYYRGNVIRGATNATLTSSNVALAQAGQYAVAVFEDPSPNVELETDSADATLTVGSGPAPAQISANSGQPAHSRRMRRPRLPASPVTQPETQAR